MRILIFITILFTLTEAGAQHRFSKFYNNNLAPDKNYDQAKDFWEMPDSGLLFPTISKAIFQVDTLGYAVTYFQVIRTKSNGDTLWTKLYRKPKFSITVKLIAPMSDGNFLLVGHAFDLVKYDRDSTGAELLLIKINSQGDTLWTKYLGIGNGDELETKMIKTHDSGFAIVGQTCDKAETNCDLFIMKLDSNANKQWHKVFTWDNNYWENPTNIIETFDHQYILTSATQNISTQLYNGYIIKTDSVGNRLWHKKLGNEGYYYCSIESVVEGNNNMYFLAGSIGDSRPNLPITKGWLLKIDSSGNYLLNKKIGEENTYNYFQYITIYRNSLIIVGQSAAYNIQSKGRTLLFNLTEEGNSIWRRVYQDSLIFNGIYSTYGTKQTLDGGFAMIGFGTDPSDSTPNQDVWLLKVDSNGCLYDNCISVGFNETVQKLGLHLKLYPNPTHQQFNLEANFKIVSLSLFNSLGQTVLEVNEYQNQSVDVSSLQPGLFWLKVNSEEGESWVEKLVVN